MQRFMEGNKVVVVRARQNLSHIRGDTAIVILDSGGEFIKVRWESGVSGPITVFRDQFELLNSPPVRMLDTRDYLAAITEIKTGE